MCFYCKWPYDKSTVAYRFITANAPVRAELAEPPRISHYCKPAYLIVAG